MKNGDRWTIVDVHQGELTVKRADGSKTITLPAEYVAANVELGYATTTHRAQGQTVDTAHTVVASTAITREALYVAATRAREGNHLYVALDDTCDVESVHGEGRYATGRDVLTAIVNNLGADLSAHEVLQSCGTSPEAKSGAGTRSGVCKIRVTFSLRGGGADHGARSGQPGNST